MVILISILAFLATYIGGMIALKLKDKLHLILGFSAGAVMGVAFFDLIPESIDLAQNYYEISHITLFIALGFAVFMILDRFIIFHGQAKIENNIINNNFGGNLKALSLVVHSVFDGLAIGFAFQVSTTVGMIVAVAVLIHDFSDGINTVNIVLRSNNENKNVKTWLLLDALAPAFGVILAQFFVVSSPKLGLIMAIFAGIFIYIGASDLLPESYHKHPTIWTTIITICGMAVLYFAIHFANI